MPLTGDISGSYGKTSIIGITGSLDLTYDGVGTEDGWLQLQEMSSNPTTPASNKGKIFVKDNGSGTTLPYFIDAAGTVTSLLGGGSSSPAGSDSQVQYNNGGSLGGASGLVYDDSNGRVGIGITSPGQVLSVYGNVSNDYVTTIDNDQSTNGHVLKLLTDGNGNGSYILDMEDGDGDIVFRARADGRFGFGPDGVSSMGAGTFVVGIDNSSHTSDIAISQRLQHLGDSDTYIDFPANDQISLEAGGITAIKLNEDSYDYIKLNSSHNDVDTIISGQNQNRVLFKGIAQEGSEQVLILSGGSDTSLNEGSYPDMCFFVSGTIGSKNSSVKGTSLFGGDLVSSGTLWANNSLVIEDLDASEEGTITIGDPAGSVYSTLTTGQHGRLTVQTRNSARDGEIWLDSSSDIIFDVHTGSTLELRENSTSLLKITPNSSNIDIQPQVSNKDIRLASQGGNTLLTVDSSDDAIKINRRFGMGSDSITSTGTLNANTPINLILAMSTTNVVGTLGDPAFAGQMKVIIGLQASSGNTQVQYTNAAGGTTTKVLTNGVGIILCSFDATGGGAYRWVPIGDVN